MKFPECLALTTFSYRPVAYTVRRPWIWLLADSDKLKARKGTIIENKTLTALRSGTRLDMKFHILHDLRSSTPFKEKSYLHFKNLHKLKLLTNFDVNMISSPGGNYELKFHYHFISCRC